MKIAVTGAAGTIGRRLCPEMAKHDEIVGIDLRGADVDADVRDLAALERAFAGCDMVVHLAGVVAVDADWEAVSTTNIGGTYNVFEAARRCGVKRVVFASSNHCVGYDEVENAPRIYKCGFGRTLGVAEPYRPDGLYGVAKAFGEVLGRYYSDAFGMDVVCIRIGSITEADDPRDESVRTSSGWLDLTGEEKFERYAATWMSHRDFARLIRCIVLSDVRFAIVYGVGDNATRFWDLEPGRAIFGFWPLDGTK